MSGRPPAPRHDWWVWVSAGVAWGLLCVGVRHVSLSAGVDIERLVAQRSESLAQVQALQRRVAEAGQLEHLERLAAAQGFVKPAPGRVVIAPAVERRGWLARWFGPADASAREEAPPPAIRPREEVMTPPRRLPARAAMSKKKSARDQKSRPARKPA